MQQRCRLEDRLIKFEIWDTAGQERFHSLAPMYYRNAQASAVVYDVTKAESLEKAKQWVKELQRQASPNIVIALVGNKIDLLSDDADATQREVPLSEAEQYADEAGLLFFETSAKTGEGVLEVFTKIAKHIPLETAKPKASADGPQAAGSRNTLVDVQRRTNAAPQRDGCAC